MLVAERKPKRDQRRRQSIMIVWHEWVEIVKDARGHGLSPSQFLALLWRNWRVSRASLHAIPPLPVEPWKRSA